NIQTRYARACAFLIGVPRLTLVNSNVRGEGKALSLTRCGCRLSKHTAVRLRFYLHVAGSVTTELDRDAIVARIASKMAGDLVASNVTRRDLIDGTGLHLRSTSCASDRTTRTVSPSSPARSRQITVG